MNSIYKRNAKRSPIKSNPQTHFTKMCSRLYVGCFNTFCNYAHSETERVTSAEYAYKNVRFIQPKIEFYPGPAFVIEFEEEEEEEEVEVKVELKVVAEEVKVEVKVVAEEEKVKEVKKPSSISLSEIDAYFSMPEYQLYRKLWLKSKYDQALEQRLVHLAKEYYYLTTTYGEEDMDCSL